MFKCWSSWHQGVFTMWHKLFVIKSQLNLPVVLGCGQSFRWFEQSPGEWTGVLGRRVFRLSQKENYILYKVYEVPIAAKKESGLSATNFVPKKIKHVKSSRRMTFGKPKMAAAQVETPDKINSNKNIPKTEDTESEKHGEILKDYFQLDVDLESLYARWCEADENFKIVASRLPGIRILRQDPVENLFSFICSSNNNIARICGMVKRMCTHFGELLINLDGNDYYSFPTIEALAQPGVEEKLRTLGFGYRAKYINSTAQYIMENRDKDWLHSLRLASYESAHAELVKLMGVGAKVADCVCLMSLDKHAAIPVDTHVWQIAARDYMPNLRQVKSINDKVYKQIGEFFRELFGEYAGWAHSVLFSGDLKKFEEVPPVKKKRKTQHSS